MQFHLRLAPMPDPDAVQRALAEQDPAVLVDTADNSGLLRVSTFLDEQDIAQTLRALGLPLTHVDVLRQPSECCGGCGG